MSENSYNNDHYDSYNSEGEQQAPEENAPQQSHEDLRELPSEEVAALWRAADLETHSDDELLALVLKAEEAKAAYEEKQLLLEKAVVRRMHTRGRTEVSEVTGLSKKQLAAWDAAHGAELPDYSFLYEELKRDQEREAARAKKAAEKAAEAAARMENILAMWDSRPTTD